MARSPNVGPDGDAEHPAPNRNPAAAAAPMTTIPGQQASARTPLALWLAAIARGPELAA